MTNFVVGATGYTGRHIVSILRKNKHRVVAHIRPDSLLLNTMKQEFQEIGALVDTTEWDFEAMRSTLKKINPSTIYCVLGTTRKRKKKSKNKDKETYKHVDYGLNALLIRACVEESLNPKIVYLSVVGVHQKSLGAYMQARYNLEEFLAFSGLDYTIARPAIISGLDRPESRRGERFAAIATNTFLKVSGLIGFTKLKKKYATISGGRLAKAMIALSEDPEFLNTFAEPEALYRLSED